MIVAPVAGALPDPVASSGVSGQLALTTGEALARVPGESVLVEQDELDVAPGMELETFASLEAEGWTAGSVLTVDVDAGVTFDYQHSGTVTERETVRDGAARDGATAAVNADFFDINNSDAPLGPGIGREDGFIKAPVKGRENAFAVAEDGAVQLAQIFLDGEVAVDGGPVLELDGVNTHALPADGIGVFTALWGDYTRAEAVGGASETAEVTIVDGVITDVTDEIGEEPPGDDTVVLVGRGKGAQALLDLEPGADAEVSYAPRSDIDEIAAAVGGNPVLVSDGEPESFSDPTPHPRTAVGISEDGSEVFLAVIDGRQGHARGMSLSELAEFMHELGAHDALNLDGGGSSTMVVRDPGTVEHEVVNSPSDGNERLVANGLAMFAEDGSGTLSDFRMLAEGDSNRVFPGLSRTVTALGLDEAHDAVDADPAWSATGDSGDVVEVTGDGATASVTGLAPGEGAVVAADGDVRGELDITVLDELAWVDPNTTQVALADADSTGRIELTGYDAAGYRAPIDPADVEVDGADGIVELVPDGAGFALEPTADNGSTVLTLRVGDVSAEVAVTIGLTEEPVAEFEDADDWTISFARADGEIEPTDGPEGRSGVRMTYDFTGPSTRAAYAAPPEQIELPGQPQVVNAWVRGDGNGSWIRMRVYDRDGALVTLNGGYTDFTGWRQLSFEVPEGTEYPLTLRDIYSVEPRNDARYHGETSFSDITVEIAPDVELPERQRFPDPVITTNGTADDAAQRIAVMNDAQFVARAPDSDIVEAARRTLREIVAEDPDALIINGDLVDESTPEDFALARTVLDEELGDADFPWYYVPGNHEAERGSIDNFVDEFGDTQHVVDLGGTRIITLNTAFGTLRAGGDEFDQIMVLREALDEAAADPSITGVVVAGHHPPNDPLPAANSQLIDRREAAMLERWLADFHAETGKPTTYVGAHAGVFDASSVDGVPYLVSGNSGKGPSGAPDNGGFTGWTLLGVEPGAEDRAEWLDVEVRPRVDAIELDAPRRLVIDESVTVAAEVQQDESRSVPVAWPMSAQWSGHRVHVGAAENAEHRDVVAIDPDTREVTALRPGVAMLRVTVNGETTMERILVGPR
ncbi:multidrug transporter [Actinobacteria bacterium YIM 96077]|uniref:Multidrug transporter n=1 Tax=Phytoactinopolyspora halophila TaxID=1981511 RepID=A0A329QHL0_9ACTN|nr:multidrug transporter [Actinobacteria bacterium YIM 96077]RAW11471.1 multidrug transporter [Phytoactinopolyspora halophila]